MARTIIGEIYDKANDAKVCNIHEDELGRMFAIGYIGTTLHELMDYCDKWGYTYQFAFGDMPELDDEEIYEAYYEYMGDELDALTRHLTYWG